MNKIININLGGMPFVIDDDAYEYMSGYLNSIRNHFAFSESREEIMYDIEMRMSELFQERLKSKQIITITELEAVIRIMGRPEEFGGEPMEDAATDFRERRTSGDYKYIKTGKRLFRDPENKVIGGVCSGIATYLGIEDPIWVRLVFGIGLFAGGAGLLLYMFLMIAVPKAVTSSDKLAMKGEPINIDNIARKVEEEIDTISRKINEFGEDLSKRSREKNWNFGKKHEKL
ncbi:MAG: PspC domain-containing protein [Saprospiraceae bacterium]|nr:PspC domain-containing protein [Saprospiraceae bacterium]